MRSFCPVAELAAIIVVRPVGRFATIPSAPASAPAAGASSAGSIMSLSGGSGRNVMPRTCPSMICTFAMKPLSDSIASFATISDPVVLLPLSSSGTNTSCVTRARLPSASFAISPTITSSR